MLILRLGLILMIIASISAGGLALLNDVTAPIIAEYKAQQQKLAREEVMEPVQGAEFEEVQLEDGLTYWRAYDDNGAMVGYIGLARGKGYSSTIETVSGFDADFKVTGLKITFQQETPGLGTKTLEVRKGEHKPWFLEQFIGLDAFRLAVRQDRGQIDAITGATITSRAVANSVRELASAIQTALPPDEGVEDGSLAMGDGDETVEALNSPGGDSAPEEEVEQ